MGTASAKASAPLTFDLPKSLIAIIESRRRQHGLATTSETVRFALARFNLDAYRPNTEEHTQISVRIPAALRRQLRTAARKKDTSVGALLRAAIESLPAKPTRVRR